MSETKWTPGPWTTRQARIPVDGEFDWCVAAAMDGAQHVIVEAFGRVAEHVRPNAEANARLIAAAPDMAEALNELLSEIDKHSKLNDRGHCDDEVWIGDSSGVVRIGAVRRARSALAKARGET